LNLNNLGFLMTAAASANSAATGALPGQFDPAAAGTADPGGSPFGLLLAQQVAAGQTGQGGGLPLQLAALFAQPATGQAASGAEGASSAAPASASSQPLTNDQLAAALLGELLSLLQAVLAANNAPDGTATGTGADGQSGAAGQAAGSALDGAAGTTPAAAGQQPQGAADAASSLADTPAGGDAAGGTDLSALAAQLATVWPQLLSFLQDSLAQQGLQLTGAAPAQTGAGLSTLPGSLVQSLLNGSAGPGGGQLAGLPLPVNAPASLRWLLSGGLAASSQPGQSAATGDATQSGQLTLPDGTALTLNLTALGAGRFNVELDNGQGQPLLTAQLTVQRLTLPVPPTASSGGSSQLLPASTVSLPPAWPVQSGPATGTPAPAAAGGSSGLAGAVAAAGTDPGAALATGGTAIPLAGQFVTAASGAAAANPAGSQPLSRAVQSAAANGGMSLPELARSVAVPATGRAVTPAAACDNAQVTVGPAPAQLTAALAASTPARTVAVPAATQRQVALPAPPVQPTAQAGSSDASSAPPNLPSVVKATGNDPAAAASAARTPERGPTATAQRAADDGALPAAAADSGNAAGVVTLPGVLPSTGLSPHLFQFTAPAQQTVGTPGMDYAAMAQRVLDATGAAQAQGDGTYQARLELNPPSLGRLYANIAVHEGQVAVEIAVASPAPRKQLEASLAGLKRSLQEAGLDVADLRVVTLDSEQDGSGGGAQQQPSGGQQRSGSRLTAGDSRLATEFSDSLPADFWPLAAVQPRPTFAG
jgi:flagellar hook-length control protein FliK